MSKTREIRLEELKKYIAEMDVKSDEFWELYKHIADKYFTLEEPDVFQNAAKMIMGWLERSINNWEDQVITVAKVVEQVFLMRHDKSPSCTGTLGFKDETFHFDIYTSEVKKDEMDKLINQAHKAMVSGNVTVKDKFGKKYFGKGGRE
jgi:hypothetical protein